MRDLQTIGTWDAQPSPKLQPNGWGNLPRLFAHGQLQEVTGQRFTFQAGETVYMAGDPSDAIYWLDDGQVRLSCLHDKGDRLSLDIVGADQVFGESALAGETVRRWSAETLEDSTVHAYPAGDILHVAERDPEVAWQISQLVFERLHQLEAKFERLAFKNVRERLQSVLVELAERYGQWDEDAGALYIPITHQDLAYMAGTTRPPASHALGELERAGLVKKGRGTILIQDLQRLRAT